jgi:hypothetical protein
VTEHIETTRSFAIPARNWKIQNFQNLKIELSRTTSDCFAGLNWRRLLQAVCDCNESYRGTSDGKGSIWKIAYV